MTNDFHKYLIYFKQTILICRMALWTCDKIELILKHMHHIYAISPSLAQIWLKSRHQSFLHNTSFSIRVQKYKKTVAQIKLKFLQRTILHNFFFFLRVQKAGSCSRPYVRRFMIFIVHCVRCFKPVFIFCAYLDFVWVACVCI